MRHTTLARWKTKPNEYDDIMELAEFPGFILPPQERECGTLPTVLKAVRSQNLGRIFYYLAGFGERLL